MADLNSLDETMASTLMCASHSALAATRCLLSGPANDDAAGKNSDAASASRVRDVGFMSRCGSVSCWHFEVRNVVRSAVGGRYTIRRARRKLQGQKNCPRADLSSARGS